MTRAQVEAIVGPPGDFTTGPVYASRGLGDDVDHAGEDCQNQEFWCNDGVRLILGFDRDSKVCAKAVTKMDLVPLSLSERAIWRIRRQWHRWFAGD
jgi:hypothetical protein